MSLIYKPSGRAREYAERALNLYNGCGHGCSYCYAPAACRKKADRFHGDPQPRKDVIAKLTKELAKTPRGSVPPVLLCFTTDPYQPIDDVHRLSQQAIYLLHQHGIGVHVLTKGGLRACRDFKPSRPSHQAEQADLGAHPDDAFAATLTFVDERQSREWEPQAASPAERLASLREAHDRGITTWASLEPVIDPEQSLELISMAAPYVDLFKVGRWNHDARANEIDWAEFGRSAVQLMERLGKPYYIKDDLRMRMAA